MGRGCSTIRHAGLYTPPWGAYRVGRWAVLVVVAIVPVAHPLHYIPEHVKESPRVRSLLRDVVRRPTAVSPSSRIPNLSQHITILRLGFCHRVKRLLHRAMLLGHETLPKVTYPLGKSFSDTTLGLIGEGNWN